MRLSQPVQRCESSHTLAASFSYRSSERYANAVTGHCCTQNCRQAGRFAAELWLACCVIVLEHLCDALLAQAVHACCVDGGYQ
jgi:hypothetical protein